MKSKAIGILTVRAIMHSNLFIYQEIGSADETGDKVSVEEVGNTRRVW